MTILGNISLASLDIAGSTSTEAVNWFGKGQELPGQHQGRGMGGKEVMHRLLAQNPEVRALVSSGYADDAIMANFQTLGF